MQNGAITKISPAILYKNGLHKKDARLVYFLPSSFERRATKLNGGDILFTRSHPQNRSIVTFGRMHVIQN